MHIITLIRAVFIIACVFVLYISRNPRQKRKWLSYGKLRSKELPKDKAALIDYFQATVPKEYFGHFYMFASVWNLVLFGQVYKGILGSQQDSFLLEIMKQAESSIGSVPGLKWLDAAGTKLPLEQIVLCWFLMQIQVFRRLYEHKRIIKSGEKARMLLVHYLGSFGYYFFACLGFLVEGLNQLCSSNSMNKLEFSAANVVNPKNLLVLMLFGYASFKQNECHRILANIRGNNSKKGDYSIPKGGWFEFLVSPHYFAEILIYIAFTLAASSVDVWNVVSWLSGINWTMFCCLLFVIVNLGATAKSTEKWYQQKFGEKWFDIIRKKPRWKLVPGLY